MRFHLRLCRSYLQNPGGVQADSERTDAVAQPRVAEEDDQQRVADLERQLAAAIAEAQLLRVAAADAERRRVESAEQWREAVSDAERRAALSLAEADRLRVAVADAERRCVEAVADAAVHRQAAADWERVYAKAVEVLEVLTALAMTVCADAMGLAVCLIGVVCRHACAGSQFTTR